jgi:hypothetical protein
MNKLNPIQAGEGLADYIRDKRVKYQEQIDKAANIQRIHETNPLQEVLELKWACDFWRAKALGTKLP